MTIQAIETQYAGCRFRSRLEARWAVFFDHLGVTWEYEPQGYQVGPDKRRYLPDFWLARLGVWVEVKGEQINLDAGLLADAVHPKSGLPGYTPFYEKAILILGPIPRPDGAYLHWQIQSAQMGGCEQYCICNDPQYSQFMFAPFPAAVTAQIPAKDRDLARGMGGDLLQFGRSLLKPHAEDLVTPVPAHRLVAPPELLAAYAAARQARFEHGETPQQPTAPADDTDTTASPEQSATPPQPDLVDDMRVLWEDLVGEELASHTEPRSLVNGELIIEADNTAYRTQVRLLASKLKELLNEELCGGAVESITARLGKSAAGGVA